MELLTSETNIVTLYQTSVMILAGQTNCHQDCRQQVKLFAMYSCDRKFII